jgi:hypothetical protein
MHMQQRYDRSQRLAYRRFRSVAGAAASPSLLLQPLAGAEQQRSVELEQTVARLVVRDCGSERRAPDR